MTNEISNHFNGKKYINPTLKEQFSPKFSDFRKMRKMKRGEWYKRELEVLDVSFDNALKQNELAITFIGHATFLIQMYGVNILTDPVWSKRASPLSWIGPKRYTEAGIDLENLPHIDLILLSHNHYDHLDKKTLKKLNNKFSPKVLVPMGDKKLVKSLGFKNVQEMDWWDSLSFNKNTQIIFTPQQHSSARGLFDRDKSLWGSFYLRQGERSVYFGGDGGYSAHFAEIKNRLSSPEIALIGIGAYKPNFFMKPIHTSPEEAVLAHQDLGAKQSVAMHFGTFRLSAEAIFEPIKDLEKSIKKYGLKAHDFIIMSEGEKRFF